MVGRVEARIEDVEEVAGGKSSLFYRRVRFRRQRGLKLAQN